ncbi:hypothetical protein [Cohnella sp. GCM10027633]|uniref:hypothetical protein n=1 Tax=unclassified Cohnella TaxID=2636738 RepID=UPI0036346A4A
MKAQGSVKDGWIESMKDLVKVQGADGNWNYDPYMHGMYNGMELMLAMAEGREPEYKDAPTEWGKDRPVEMKVEAQS